jgi:hypothetical protein
VADLHDKAPEMLSKVTSTASLKDPSKRYAIALFWL